ncbi:MAG: GNAT family N-acetyltransferase, partial [Oscillospiraceae bacterium]
MEIIKGTNTAEFKRLYDDFAQSVFDVSFMPWFKLDVWTDDCEIYCMVHEGKIIANVSVYKMRMRIGGKKRSAIQLGAVGTLPQYRRQHISKQLMEYVFEKYKSVPAFLVANCEVKDFYPKFGFKLLEEKIPVTLP